MLVAYVRLFELGKTDVAYASVLASYVVSRSAKAVRSAVLSFRAMSCHPTPSAAKATRSVSCSIPMTAKAPGRKFSSKIELHSRRVGSQLARLRRLVPQTPTAETADCFHVGRRRNDWQGGQEVPGDARPRFANPSRVIGGLAAISRLLTTPADIHLLFLVAALTSFEFGASR